MQHDIERQMRAAERERRRAIAFSWSIGGVFVVGISIALGAWILGSRGAQPLTAGSPADIVDASSVQSDPPTLDPAPTSAPPTGEPAVQPTVPEPDAAPEPTPEPSPAKKAVPAPPKKTAPSVQRFAIQIGDLGYEPTIVTAKAGTPIQLTIAQGDGCSAGFLMAELGVSADNSTRAAVVSLPALSPGTYRFTCGMEMVEGRLVVE